MRTTATKRVEVPAEHSHWAPARFEIAMPGFEPPLRPVRGWEWKGLGLRRSSFYRSRYRRENGERRITETWSVYHLNTGHAVRHFQAGQTRAFELATEIAALADWTFVGLEGWKNSEPELPERLAAWHRSNDLAAIPAGGGQSEVSAQVIAARRW